MNAPTYPAGKYQPEPNPSHARKSELIAEITTYPKVLTDIVRSLPVAMLDQPYRNWTARQIVHHLADSHVNAYVRFRMALTEESPTIKPYLEGLWAELPDAKTADVADSLALLTAVHQRWSLLLLAMTDEQFERAYVHPQYQKTFRLAEVLGMYAHHGRHHAAQLEWMRANR